ncbi:MAG: hypothetical protein OQJ89_00380, partial [Kangiellaceae bacterium]|nr:hypothetical protein [Kangiellaceae bacterium]
AIMVKREAAAFAYHNTVARQIDPALMEWSGAGVFNAKVFPLMPQKTHRIVIGYDIDLSTSETGLNMDLPLPSSNIDKRIHLLIDQHPEANVFVQKFARKKLRSPKLIEKFEGISQTSFQGKAIDGLKITIANPQKPTIFGEDEVGRYFAHQFIVDLPQIESRTNEQVIFALDTSLSSVPDKYYRWTKLVNAILSNNQSTIKRFNLMSFGIQQKWWREQFVENNQTNRDKLRSYLNKLILEGATDLFSAIQNVASPYWNTNKIQFDLFVMSDGAATWGEESPHLISAQVNKGLVNRLFTYRLNQGVEDSEMLAHLAQATNGVNYVIDSDSGIQGLSIAHNQQPWIIEELHMSQGDDLLIRGKPGSLYSGQLLTIAGRLKSDIAKGAQARLVMSNGSEQVEQLIEMSNLIESKLASRIYGQIAVEQLESIDPLLKLHASSYANHYRVPGKSSSLLMLETAEDYRQYQISPEQDKETIIATRVSQLFANLAKDRLNQLLSYKSKFVDLYDSLNKMKQIRFEPPEELTQLIQRLPDASFQLNGASSRTANRANHSATKISKRSKYAKAVSKGEIKYAVAIKEANKRLDRGNKMGALQAISSLVEQMPKDVAVLREVAFNAQSWQLKQQAYDLHFKVAKLRPYEPQSYSFLAKLAQENGNDELALLFYELGLASDWQGRFGDFEFIHTIDYLNFLKQLRNSKSVHVSIREFGLARLEQLGNSFQLDSSKLIVAIAWNTDRTDIDLHVVEPTGEECYYQHKRTQSGGFITRDVTTGYGPEMYINPKGPKGIYKFYVNYYRSDTNKLGLDTKVYVRTIKHWGTDEQVEKSYTVSLRKAKDKAKVGQVRL